MLSQVFLASIAGFVPQKMSQCLAVFLDFAYTARRSEHDTLCLGAMEEALQYFHDLRTIFIDTGVRPDGFGLPRQHSLVHYILSIRQFGSPNGLCSSITESKHIEAVKETWRRSNRNEPIGQMIRTLSRLSKLSSAAVEFGRRGMLQNDVLTAARLALGDETAEDIQAAQELSYLEAQDLQDVDGPRVEAYTYLGERQCKFNNPAIMILCSYFAQVFDISMILQPSFRSHAFTSLYAGLSFRSYTRVYQYPWSWTTMACLLCPDV